MMIEVAWETEYQEDKKPVLSSIECPTGINIHNSSCICEECEDLHSCMGADSKLGEPSRPPQEPLIELSLRG